MMAAPPLSSLPATLKPIQLHLKSAIEHDKRDPVISYYCRLYALQRGMGIDKSSPDAREYLVHLMDYLEVMKESLKTDEAMSNEIVGQAHVENYAMKLFMYADNEDRAGRFNKNVVKSFLTAGMLFDVLTTFGNVPEEMEKNNKYAKWKATYIHKCLKNGETPVPGPLEEEGAPAPHIGFDPAPGPSVPPSNMNFPGDNTGLFPAAGAHAPPSTPQEPASSYQPSPHRSPQPAPRSVPAQPIINPASDWAPPPNPSGVQLTAEQFQKGIKYCKYASSAMQYEDSKTAIDNLTKALKLLTSGQDSP